MLLEFLLAIAFLVIVSGFMLKMHQSRLDHDRVATDRLRQQLAIENLGEQLASVSYSGITDAASSLADQSSAEIRVEPFTTESQNGKHLIIELQSKSGLLTHHLWRLEPKP